MLDKIIIFIVLIIWLSYAFYTVINNKRKGLSNCSGTCTNCKSAYCNSNRKFEIPQKQKII
jgi:hypothetical protein